MRHMPRNAKITQQRLIETAADIIAEQGVAGLRVDEVARRARVNKRMIYHYFGSKTGLWERVLERQVEHLCLSVPELSPGSKDLLRAEFASNLQMRHHDGVGLVAEAALRRAAKLVLRRVLDGPVVRASLSDADWRDLFLVLCRLTFEEDFAVDSAAASERQLTARQNQGRGGVGAKPTYQLRPKFRFE